MENTFKCKMAFNKIEYARVYAAKPRYCSVCEKSMRTSTYYQHLKSKAHAIKQELESLRTLIGKTI